MLERLAQDNPAHRQAVVDVICAYLRRPFPAVAPASMPDPKNVKIRKEPGAEDKMESDGTDDAWRKERGKWRQERRVRLTAQRILTEHLRDDASFSEAALGGEANFPEVDFRGDALFSGAGALHFDQARILSPGASHPWPTGWHLTVAGSTGYTVIRSDGDGGS